MEFNIHKYRPEVMYVTDGGLIKAAVSLPEDTSKGAESVFAKDCVSLTHLVKEASELFQGGRVFVDWNTVGDFSFALDDVSGLLKLANCFILPPKVEEFIKIAAGREDYEMQLWEKYHKTGDKKALNELRKSMMPIVRQRIKPWVRNSPLPSSAVEAEGLRLLTHGINTYDPNKGAQLKTHVWNQLNKIHRYGYTYQNVGSIPEPRAAKVGTFQNAFEILSDKYNREPTLQELQDELGWGTSDIKAMQSELRRDLVLDETLGPVIANNTDPATEALYLTYHDANPKQKLIMEHTFDEFQEKPTLSVDQIAEKLRLPVNEVRKEYKWIASQIQDLIKPPEISDEYKGMMRVVPW